MDNPGVQYLVHNATEVRLMMACFKHNIPTLKLKHQNGVIIHVDYDRVKVNQFKQGK